MWRLCEVGRFVGTSEVPSGRGPLEWTSLVPTKRPTVTKTPGGYIWCLCHYQPLIKGEFTHNQKQVVKQASYVSPRRLCDTRLFRRYEWSSLKGRGPLEWTSLVPTKRPTVTKTPGGYIWCLCHYQPLIKGEFTLSEAVVTQTYMYVASLWSRSFFLRWITADPSPWGNFTPPTKQ